MVKSTDLKTCLQQARQTHPLVRQNAILDQIHQVQQNRLDRAALPRLDWNTRASFQTEAVSLPIELPNIDLGLPNLPLGRFQTTVDGSYLLYDGGIKEAQKTLSEAQLRTDRQATEVQLEQLNQQVATVYFGILQLQEKEKILEVSADDLLVRIGQVRKLVQHGVRLPGDVDRLQARLLQLQLEQQQARTSRLNLQTVLGSLTGDSTIIHAELLLPGVSDFVFSDRLQRTELNWFALQKEQILAKEELITAGRKPKVSAFAQAGLGYPNPLNFFDDALSPFGIIGIQATYAITDWKTSKLDRQLLSLQSQLIDQQKDIFLYQLEQQEVQFDSRLSGAQTQRSLAQQELQLQEKILLESAAQLAQGVLTSSDYITQVNATLRARLLVRTYELEIEHIKIDYLILKGLFQ